MSRTCTAFSAPMVRQVKLQSALSASPSQLSRVRAAFQDEKRWNPGSTVTIAFMGGTPAQQDIVKQVVRDTFRSQANLGLTLEFVEGKQGQIRITFDPNKGAYSYLGNDSLNIPRGEATMNLGWLDEDKNFGVIKHEFGHALGLIHEHQQPDAKINWNRQKVQELFGGPPNYWSNQQIQDNVFATVPLVSSNSSAYDPQSIMHYIFDCECFTNCQPDANLGCICRHGSSCVCTPGMNPTSIQELSKTDIEVLQRMYPVSNGPSDPDENGENPSTPPDENASTSNGWAMAGPFLVAFLVLFAVALLVLGILVGTKKVYAPARP